jgi:hypothetical protein
MPGFRTPAQFLQCAFHAIALLAVTAAIAFLIFNFAAHADESRFAKLRDWVEDQIYFFKDSKDSSRLFTRRTDVRAGVHLDDVGIQGEVKEVIALLSTASGLSHEFTRLNTNLIAVVGSPINLGDRPNPEFLRRRIGLPESGISIITQSTGWAEGCGIYSFTGSVESGTEGQVSLSLALADSRLPPEKIKDCLIDGIIRAFGMRAHSRTVLRSRDGYLQYAVLLAALRTCDQSLDKSDETNGTDEPKLRERYRTCAMEQLAKRM